MGGNTSRPDGPPRVEVPRFELCQSLSGGFTVRRSAKPGVTSVNQLLAGLGKESLAVVEFRREQRDGWIKENLFQASLVKEFPSTFRAEGQTWHLIGGTINGAGRGELLACTNREVVASIVPGWQQLDGLNRVKTLSRLMQPSTPGLPFELRLLVIDDPNHDGDALLGQSGITALRAAFRQPDAAVFKCVSHWLKLVFRKAHRSWDMLPDDVSLHSGQLSHRGQAIDGILYRDNIKLYKDRFPTGQVAFVTHKDIRLHATESRTNFHRAGLSRQLLQYLPAEIAAPLIGASDIPLMASNWAKAITGDVAALRYLLHHDPDDNAEDHEIRNQLLRHLNAGCQDVTIPYLRQRVLPLLAGVFRNRIRKGRCPGAYLYAAPSTRLADFDIAVPGRMLSHEERDQVRSGRPLAVMATRYPITGHQSINRMTITAFHNGAVVYINPSTWVRSFQGDFDGDCITILRANPQTWENSLPYIPPNSPTPKPTSTPKALEQAAMSKRDVALGESVLADYIHHCWEKTGRLDPAELNELGTRVICSAVDRAKHGTVDWGLSADQFSRDYLPDRHRHQHSLLAAKELPDVATHEAELRSRLWMLKCGKFGYERSGWELLLSLLHDWVEGVDIMPVGSHSKLHERVLQLHALLPAPDKRTFELVRHARKRWAQAVDHWKRSGDDQAMRAFTDRFQAWISRTDEAQVAKVLLELGRQLLRPKKKGNASLFLSQVPRSILNRLYLDQRPFLGEAEPPKAEISSSNCPVR